MQNIMMKTIAIDFDGVIHKYREGWKDGSIYDEGDQKIFALIRELMGKGYSVYILSARSPRQILKWIEDSERCGCIDYDETVCAMTGYYAKVIPFWVKFWNQENVLGITRKKLPAIYYIDDRAVLFDGDVGKLRKKLGL